MKTKIFLFTVIVLRINDKTRILRARKTNPSRGMKCKVCHLCLISSKASRASVDRSGNEDELKSELLGPGNARGLLLNF